MILKFTHVDAVTGVPVTEAPASNGPAFPAVADLVFTFALESRYPTTAPVMFGTCPDDADTSVPGVLAVLTDDEYSAAVEAEHAARREKRAAAALVRRNRLLAESDWLTIRHRDQLDAGSATALTDEQFRQVLTYREALRQIDAQPGFPDNIDWPALDLTAG